ncbi:unnamed protein product [Pleuronectes platessa]|uniref:Uncharacterized protein n=1 Tax=Pleuronectes platessa TaxID=8262 RepID=A0A9N7TGE3_PLEPL|nr:unnamed protein product [Pleuronectes platessa]
MLVLLVMLVMLVLLVLLVSPPGFRRARGGTPEIPDPRQTLSQPITADIPPSPSPSLPLSLSHKEGGNAGRPRFFLSTLPSCSFFPLLSSFSSSLPQSGKTLPALPLPSCLSSDFLQLRSSATLTHWETNEGANGRSHRETGNLRSQAEEERNKHRAAAERATSFPFGNKKEKEVISIDLMVSWSWTQSLDGGSMTSSHLTATCHCRLLSSTQPRTPGDLLTRLGTLVYIRRRASALPLSKAPYSPNICSPSAFIRPPDACDSTAVLSLAGVQAAAVTDVPRSRETASSWEVPAVGPTAQQHLQTQTPAALFPWQPPHWALLRQVVLGHFFADDTRLYVPSGDFLPLFWDPVLTLAQADPEGPPLPALFCSFFPPPHHSRSDANAHLCELPTSMLLNKVSRKWLCRPQVHIR